jgi:hypothetical protein
MSSEVAAQSVQKTCSASEKYLARTQIWVKSEPSSTTKAVFRAIRAEAGDETDSCPRYGPIILGDQSVNGFFSVRIRKIARLFLRVGTMWNSEPEMPH